MAAPRVSLAAFVLVVTGCSKSASSVAAADAGLESASIDAGGDPDSGDNGGAPPCSAEVNKGPWVVAVDGSSAKLRWESCVTTPGTVTVTPESGGPAIDLTASVQTVTTSDTVFTLGGGTDWASTWYENELPIAGLAPATCYGYVVDRDPTAKGRFCTARARGDAFSFAAVGDTNPGLGSNMRDLEAQLFGGQFPIDFTLHTGDIQYYQSGVESYQMWFQWMEPLLRRGAILPAIGNHESEQPHEMQEMVLRFWGGAGFDGVDTSYDYQSGGVWFFTIDTELDISAGSDQLKWLVSRLAAVSTRPDYRFSVVYQHRPMFTCGDSDDHPDEQAYLEPFFTQYKVPLVLWGHMHGYERFAKSGITYVTTAGGGGAIGMPSENLSRAECVYRVAAGAYFHAMVFDVSTTGLRGRAIDKSGAIDDDFTIAAP